MFGRDVRVPHVPDVTIVRIPVSYSTGVRYKVPGSNRGDPGLETYYPDDP